jgi:hypothetical protein
MDKTAQQTPETKEERTDKPVSSEASRSREMGPYKGSHLRALKDAGILPENFDESGIDPDDDIVVSNH